MGQEGLCRKKYPSDLTDEQWAIVSPLIPPAKQNPRGGRPRKVDLTGWPNPMASRVIAEALGAQWRCGSHP